MPDGISWYNFNIVSLVTIEDWRGVLDKMGKNDVF